MDTVGYVSSKVEDPMRRSKDDTETAATLETAVDYSPPAKRQQHTTFDREDSRQTLFEILEEGDHLFGQTSQFRSHPVVVAFETIAILTLLTQRLWFLKGMFFVLTAYIVFIVHKWVMYVIRNEELKRAKQGLTTYFRKAMREAEKTVKGGKTRRTMEGTALALRGTAQSFTVRFLKDRHAALQKQTHIEIAILKQQRKIIREKLNMGLSKGLPFTSSNI